MLLAQAWVLALRRQRQDDHHNLKTETHLSPVLGHGHHLNSSPPASLFPSSFAFCSVLLHLRDRHSARASTGPVFLVGSASHQVTPQPYSLPTGRLQSVYVLIPEHGARAHLCPRMRKYKPHKPEKLSWGCWCATIGYD